MAWIVWPFVSEWVQALALWLGYTRSLINSNNNCLIFMTYIVWPFVRVGASAAIVVGLRYIPFQIQQQLFNFHDLNRMTFCQSGCKRSHCSCASLYPFSNTTTIVWFSWHKSFDLLSEWVQALALWLGYTNSMLNPIIYSVLHRQTSSVFNNLSRKISCFLKRHFLTSGVTF